jgi:hemerythrin-like metal-binding protein
MEREADAASHLAGRAEEHRQLAEFIDRYQAAVSGGEAAGELVTLLEAVSDFARSHHAEEERLMSFVGYPQLRSHRQAHRKLGDLIAELVFRLRAAETSAIAETETLLRSWFTQHLNGPDADLHAYLTQRFGGTPGQQ